MNPSSHGELLPPVMPESAPSHSGESPVGAVAPEAFPQPSQGMPAVTPPAPPVIAMPTAASAPASGLPVLTPMIADDADLIEKEWVIKAKQIVAQTRVDPHAQSQQVNQLKADYIKKRYNKDVKVEGAA